MRRIIRRYRLGYVLSILLWCIGLCSVFVVFWEIWSELFTDLFSVSALWNILWTEEVNIFNGLVFKLIFFVILAVVAWVSGIAVFMFSRQWFYLAAGRLNLQCPFCKKYWVADSDRGQVLCPHCRHLVHPKLKRR